MNFHPAKPSPVRGFDMTPMIDIVLQLIIFFMFSSHFTQVNRTPVDLPEQLGDAAPGAERPGAIVVDMDRDGRLLLQRVPIEPADLAAHVQAYAARTGADPGDVDLLIRADQSCPAARLNEVAVRLTGIGLRTWKLGTADQPPAAGGVGGG